ncbi:TLD-domain-containing protein [Trametes sanguinea]|nr:TLD-domain-containing protein [Trametes sanguinea]
MQSQNFFGKFVEDARAASEKKRREVLDELLQHEDDPLYWLQGPSNTDTTSGKSTPVASIAFQPHAETPSLIDLDSPSEERSMKPLVPPVLPYSPTPASTSPPHPIQPHAVPVDTLVDLDSPGPNIKVTEHEREARPSTSPQHVKTSPHIRSPSLPPSSPTRMSPPEIQRTQSYFSSPSFPSRIVSSLLSSAIRQPASRGTHSTSTSTSSHSHTDDPSTSRLPPVVAAAASHLAGFSRSAPHSRAATVSEGVTMSSALDASITHGTPFASHPFVPPSGAPGFAGDRQWDKGFEYDKTQIERKSVRLVGRKELTVPVLTVEIADMLRPFFPALARLPRSWTLLYSLDQHGISLNTLYARCQDFKGSALLIVRDANNAIFGAWMGEGIHPSRGSYYGSGESFLWQLVGKDRVRVFKWTGKNDYVALCEPDYISFGGGDGHYGLWLDQTLSCSGR